MDLWEKIVPSFKYNKEVMYTGGSNVQQGGGGLKCSTNSIHFYRDIKSENITVVINS